MKIGVNLWIWGSPFRTDEHLELIPQIKAWGGEVIELATEDDADIDTRAVRQALDGEGMSASVIGVFGSVRDLSHPDAAVRQNGINYAKRSVDTCAEIGATIFSGAVAGVGGGELLLGDTRHSRINQAAECLHVLGDYSAQAGVQFVIEILNRYETNFLNTAAEARELINLVNHPAVGIHLDTFHMSHEENNLGDAIRQAGNKLMHFHGSDSHRGTPGTGLVHWDDVATALRDINYDGYVVIESFNPRSPIGPLARFWRFFAESPETLAREGIAFLKEALLGEGEM